VLAVALASKHAATTTNQRNILVPALGVDGSRQQFKYCISTPRGSDVPQTGQQCTRGLTNKQAGAA
jgi:hypothetical protein